MENFNIELVNFTPVPNSTLLDYFNKRLNELKNYVNVTEISVAKLILMPNKPPISRPQDYLLSQHIRRPGSPHLNYHICVIGVRIKNVECTIQYYDEVYFETAIDDAVEEAMSRCTRYG